MSTRIALVLAVVLGLVAAFAARAWIGQEEQRIARREQLVPIVVAAHHLRRGQVIRTADLTQDEIPAAYVIRGMRAWGEARTLEGRVLLQDMESGWPLLETVLEANRDRPGTVESLVPPEKRAVTLRIDAEDSHGYMIRPGDYIDVLAFMDAPWDMPRINREGRAMKPAEAPAAERGAPKRLATVLLAEAVPVLAIDNHGVDMGSAGGRRQQALTYRTFTLALDADNAYRLLDARNQGAQLKFPLRARGDAGVKYGGLPVRFSVDDIDYNNPDDKRPMPEL